MRYARFDRARLVVFDFCVEIIHNLFIAGDCFIFCLDLLCQIGDLCCEFIVLMFDRIIISVFFSCF